MCYTHYGYSQQNISGGSTTVSINQLLHFRMMWNYDILDLRRIFALQVRKIWPKYEDLTTQVCFTRNYCAS